MRGLVVLALTPVDPSLLLRLLGDPGIRQNLARAGGGALNCKRRPRRRSAVTTSRLVTPSRRMSSPWRGRLDLGIERGVLGWRSNEHHALSRSETVEGGGGGSKTTAWKLANCKFGYAVVSGCFLWTQARQTQTFYVIRDADQAGVAAAPMDITSIRNGLRVALGSSRDRDTAANKRFLQGWWTCTSRRCQALKSEDTLPPGG